MKQQTASHKIMTYLQQQNSKQLKRQGKKTLFLELEYWYFKLWFRKREKQQKISWRIGSKIWRYVQLCCVRLLFCRLRSLSKNWILINWLAHFNSSQKNLICWSFSQEAWFHFSFFRFENLGLWFSSSELIEITLPCDGSFCPQRRNIYLQC